MDTKTFIQFLIAVGIFLVLWWLGNYLFFGDQTQEQAPPRQQRRQEEMAPAPEPEPEPEPEQPEAAEPQPDQPQPAPRPDQGIETIEHLKLTGTHLSADWTNVGAGLRSLTLLDERYRAPYRPPDQEKRPPLKLLDEFQEGYYSDVVEELTLSGEREGARWESTVETADLRYRVEEQPGRLVFEAPVNGPHDTRLTLRKTVTATEEYHMAVTLQILNESPHAVEVACALRGPAGIERETLETRYLGTVVGVQKGPDKYDVAERNAPKLRKTDPDPNKSTQMAWAGVVNHYFAAVTMLEDSSWARAVESLQVIEEDIIDMSGPRWSHHPSLPRKDNRWELARNCTVLIRTEPISIQPGEHRERSYRIVACPKKNKVLEAYNAGLPQLIKLGLFPPLSRLAIGMLNFLHSIIPNYGIAIILLTAFVRMLLHPLTRKSQMSMARMQKLQPEIAELQRKHGDDKETLAKEQMKLWKKYGVSPLSGCGPMLLQMPVLISLFGALRAAIELRHAGFLWVGDLSRPDTLFHLPFSLPFLGDQFNLLPLIMAVAMFMNSRLTTQATSGQAQQQQKMLKWMPLIFVFVLYSFPSGLCLYLTCSMGIGVLERWLIQRKADRIELTPVAQRGREKKKGRRPIEPEKSTWMDKLHDFVEKHTRPSGKN